MKTNTHFCLYFAFVVRMKNVSDRSRSENRNTHFNSVTFSGNRAVYEIMWKNTAQPYRPEDKMAHAHCMLDT